MKRPMIDPWKDYNLTLFAKIVSSLSPECLKLQLKSFHRSIESSLAFSQYIWIEHCLFISLCLDLGSTWIFSWVNFFAYPVLYNPDKLIVLNYKNIRPIQIRPDIFIIRMLRIKQNRVPQLSEVSDRTKTIWIRKSYLPFNKALVISQGWNWKEHLRRCSFSANHASFIWPCVWVYVYPGWSPRPKTGK